ncbi:MAG: hypothetical protein H7Z37_08895, partial [Pyrinomonadaceae bacterium]|nr:hypothetical protein [Pyrinomonadaceae bacterium]
DANNELQALREAEEREIAKILFDLTESLRWDLDGLEIAAEVATELDFVNAKARFLREFDAIVPTISDDDTLELIDARHPLLQQNLRESERKIVPLTFDLTDGKPVMIISGANAGGKTVVLKTAGLLSLMALSGLPIPARRAQVPFYQSILADIGDQQSIAANLSTFTSHISNISKMMEICETPSLVLLDEVGTGTDPEEGSALGVAVVDYFRNSCHAQVIASTHYRGLKMYAANNDFVQNASVEFNEKTLQPTYKLLVGIAGASSGLSIAQRFGIPAHVIEKAKENVDSSSLEAENYLHNLRREVSNANEIRHALEDERQVVAESFAKAELDFKRRETERQREFEKEIVKTIEDFERQAKVIVENIEDKVTKSRLEKEAAARRSELKRLATESVQGSKFRVQSSNQESDAAQKAEDQTLSIGKKVRLKNFGSIGTIEKIERR